jgi:hypothetical protein
LTGKRPLLLYTAACWSCRRPSAAAKQCARCRQRHSHYKCSKWPVAHGARLAVGPKGLDRVGRQNPSAEAETREGDGKGSPLYRLHMWYMRWGNTHEGMQMVRRFAEKEMDESSDC